MHIIHYTQNGFSEGPVEQRLSVHYDLPILIIYKYSFNIGIRHSHE